MKKRSLFLVSLSLLLALALPLTAFAMSRESLLLSKDRAEAQAELDNLSPDEVMEKIRTKQNMNKLVQYTVNEYEHIQTLQKKTDEELFSDGYSQKEILSIRNYEQIFDDHIQVLSSLDDNSLRRFNYSDEQISIIRRYAGTPAQRYAMAATCNISVDVDRCSYNSSTKRTSGRVTTSFVWYGVPVIKLKDTLATGWNEWYLAGKTANIKYQYIYNSNSKWQAPTFVPGSDGGTSLGCGYAFDTSLDDNYYYAVEGFEVFSLDTSGAKDLHATGLYAKRNVSWFPTITFSYHGVSVDISVDSLNQSYRGGDSKRVEY